MFFLTLVYVLVPIQTKWLLELTRVDPLFYSPEVSVEELTASIEKLKEAELNVTNGLTKRLNEKTVQGADDTRPLEQIAQNGFLPIKYLAELVNTLSVTENFFEEPTALHGLQMLRASRTAARAYTAEIDSLTHLLETLPKEEYSYKKFIQFGSYTDIETLSYDLALIRNNAVALLNETNGRLRCFTLLYCKGLLPKPEYKANTRDYTRPSISDFDILSEKNIANVVSSENAQRTGPYIIESACFIDAYVPFYIFKSDGIGFMPKQANENYYHDIRVMLDRNPDNAYARALMDTGISFDDQPESTEYRCTDLTYWATLSTIDYLHTVQERSDVTTTHAVATLLDSFYKNPQLEDNQKNILIIENKMIDMPGMLTYISNSLESYAIHSKYYDKVEPFYLIGMRSAYSLTYNTFSKSVWRINRRPRLTLGKIEHISNVYTTYHSLREIYSDDEIKEFNLNIADYLK